MFQGRAVQTSKSLDEGLSIVVSLRTSEVAFEENSGKLVYLSGGLNTKEVSSVEDKFISFKF